MPICPSWHWTPHSAVECCSHHIHCSLYESWDLSLFSKDHLNASGPAPADQTCRISVCPLSFCLWRNTSNRSLMIRRRERSEAAAAWQHMVRGPHRGLVAVDWYFHCTQRDFIFLQIHCEWHWSGGGRGTMRGVSDVIKNDTVQFCFQGATGSWTQVKDTCFITIPCVSHDINTPPPSTTHSAIYPGLVLYSGLHIPVLVFVRSQIDAHIWGQYPNQYVGY